MTYDRSSKAKTKLSTYVQTFTHNKKPKHVYKLVENAEFLCLACLAAWMEFQSSHTSTRFEVVTIFGLESFIRSTYQITSKFLLYIFFTANFLLAVLFIVW